ncbi:MAG: ferredoxin--NADP reductase [Planctomycetota bacterium]|jgi:ferredoxin--NADP+ reductase
MADGAVAPELNAVVTQRVEVAPGLIILRVAPEGWELPDFVPGQYVVLALPGSAPRIPGSDPDEKELPPNKLIKRAYSIASSSVAREYLEFYVALVHSGALTPRLWCLDLGSRLWLGRKITGMFTLNSVPEECNVVLLSTGTGVAPYVSMVRTFLTSQTDRRFAVVHGARHSWDLGYQPEMIALARVCPHLDYVPIISRPQEEPTPWPGQVGYCQDVWNDGVVDDLWGFRPNAENTHVFLCGNPAMIEDMLVLLERDGFREHKKKAPGQVHLEKYW